MGWCLWYIYYMADTMQMFTSHWEDYLNIPF